MNCSLVLMERLGKTKRLKILKKSLFLNEGPSLLMRARIRLFPKFAHFQPRRGVFAEKQISQLFWASCRKIVYLCTFI